MWFHAHVPADHHIVYVRWYRVLLMSISNQYWDEIVLNSLWMSYWPCLGTDKKVLLGRVLSFLFCVCPTEDAWMASLPVTVQVHILSLCASPFMPRVSYLNFAAVTFQLALEKPDSYKKCGGRFFSLSSYCCCLDFCIFWYTAARQFTFQRSVSLWSYAVDMAYQPVLSRSPSNRNK